MPYLIVNISGDTNPTDLSPANGHGIVNNDYRIGTYEVTNDQWNKFTNINLKPPSTLRDIYRYTDYCSRLLYSIIGLFRFK